MLRFPKTKIVATTLREVHNTNHHSWSAVAWVNGTAVQAPTAELRVLDRVGGGDGFAAGFIYGLLSGKTPDEAVKLGWAHGALLTTFPGDTTMATLDQVEQFAQGGSATDSAVGFVARRARWRVSWRACRALCRKIAEGGDDRGRDGRERLGQDHDREGAGGAAWAGCSRMRTTTFRRRARRRWRRELPLTDEDREPWLTLLNRLLRRWDKGNIDGVLACSALKERYHDMLKSGIATSLQFVLLDGSKELIARRLAERHHEYMNPVLLESQLATLEDPDGAFRIVNDRSPDEIVDQILAKLGRQKKIAEERGSNSMGHSLFDLTGKTAVVVGGTSGIGLAMAVGLAEAGADVVASSRRQEQVDEAAAPCRSPS